MQARPEVLPGAFKILANGACNTEFVAPRLVRGTLVEGSRMLLTVPAGTARALMAMLVVSEVHPFTDGTGRLAHLVMPKVQQRFWPDLGPAAHLGFVLYGGTAIALRLGHRQSVDFDFFSERPLDKEAIQSAFGFMSTCVYLQDEKNTLAVLVTGLDPASNPDSDADTDSEQSHVKISFFGTIGFGRVGEPDWTHDGVVQVASLDDLMATKVKVLVLQRAEAKDYRDVAAMVQAGVSLSTGLASARAIHSSGYGAHLQRRAGVFWRDEWA